MKIDGVGTVEGNRGFCGEHDALGGSFCIDAHPGTDTESRIFRGRESVAEVFAHDEVLIGAALARTLRVEPGDTIRVPGRSAMHTMTVGAIWESAENVGLSVTVPDATFAELYGERLPTAMRIEPTPGVTLEELDARIEAANLDPDLRSLVPVELSADFKKSIGAFVTPFAALQRGMLLVALIAVVSTLLLVGVQRRREHGLLLAVGMEPAGLGRMVLTEAGMVGITASIVGTLAGLATYVAIMWVSPLFTGLAAPWHFSATGPLLYGGAGLVFVLVGAALPAWRTASIDPALALRYE
jgi:putative ABC transport system permease protein